MKWDSEERRRRRFEWRVALESEGSSVGYERRGGCGNIELRMKVLVRGSMVRCLKPILCGEWRVKPYEGTTALAPEMRADKTWLWALE